MLFTISACSLLTSSPDIAKGDEGALLPSSTPVTAIQPSLVRPSPSPLPSPTLQPQEGEMQPPTDNNDVSAAVTSTVALPIAIEPATNYDGPDGRVTIIVPEGGRYLVVGDSQTFGSVFEGTNTYEHICENRWPFVQQLEAETGIASTASLDRGNSFINPFLTIKILGIPKDLCDGPAGLSTSVPGSNSSEWVNTLRYNPTFIDALQEPDNQVVLFVMAADVFAPKIDKPPVPSEEYIQNIGLLFEYLRDFGKIIYAAPYPHVAAGTFINEDELDSVNQVIDEYNAALRALIEKNGFQNQVTGQWVDFGTQVIEQDNFQLRVKVMQNGPDLDILSDGELGTYRVFDGLHYTAEGYNKIGSAWAQALMMPVRTTAIFRLP